MARPELTLPRAAGAVAALVVVAGTAIRQTQGGLGTASPPYIMDWDPRAGVGWTLAAVLAGVALVLLGPRALAARRGVVAIAGSTGLALAFGLALNAIGYGPDGWSRVFDLGPGGSFEAKNEYLPSLPVLDEYGPRFLLDRFAELVPALAPNAGAHPPGMLLVLHGLGIGSASGMAALCIAAAVGCVPATWAVARAAGLGEDDARRAALLCAACPVLLLYGITSADALYALIAAGTAALLAAPHRGLRAMGCLALAVATLFSWALLAVGAWATVLAWRREGLGSAVRLAAACAVAVVGWFAVLAVAFGYDAVDVLLRTSELYAGSVRTERPLWFWVLGSPTAWGTLLGLAVAGGWLMAVGRRTPAGLALAVVVVVASVAGFTAAETERIWLPFVPLACVAAAPEVPPGRLRAGLVAGVAVAIAIAALFETVW